MKTTILLFLGALFVINIFFRVRLMKLFKQIKENQIQIGFNDLLSKEKFSILINEKYPAHASLLTAYRQSMLLGLGMLVVVLIGLTVFILIKPA